MIILNKVIHIGKDKYMVSLIDTEMITQINSFIKQIDSDMENKFMVTKGSVRDGAWIN